MGKALLIVILGLLTIILSILKPSFYWESRKAKRLRRLIGDSGATIFYVVIGISIMALGLFTTI